MQAGRAESEGKSPDGGPSLASRSCPLHVQSARALPPTGRWRRWLLAICLCAGAGWAVAVCSGLVLSRPPKIANNSHEGEATEVARVPVDNNRPVGTGNESAGVPLTERRAPPQRHAPAPTELANECKQLADQLRSDFPSTAAGIDVAARIYYAFNERDKAENCWQTCLKLDPEFAEAWCNLGEAAWEHGEFEKAADCLQKAAVLRGSLSQEDVSALADSLLNCGNASEAARVLEKAAGERPLTSPSLLLLGQAYLELGEYEKAKGRFEAGLVLDPRWVGFHFGLATAYSRLNQPEKAAKHRAEYARLMKSELALPARRSRDLSQADLAEVRSFVRECRVHAGKVYASHRRFDEAEAQWLRAAALDPQSPEPRALLEKLHRARGEGGREG